MVTLPLSKEGDWEKGAYADMLKGSMPSGCSNEGPKRLLADVEDELLRLGTGILEGKNDGLEELTTYLQQERLYRRPVLGLTIAALVSCMPTEGEENKNNTLATWKPTGGTLLEHINKIVALQAKNDKIGEVKDVGMDAKLSNDVVDYLTTFLASATNGYEKTGIVQLKEILRACTINIHT
jgi:hypothetical protein